MDKNQRKKLEDVADGILFVEENCNDAEVSKYLNGFIDCLVTVTTILGQDELKKEIEQQREC